MADLSLKGLRNRIETEKKGYTNTLAHDSLLTLKNLINNMYTIRSGTTGVRCTTHTGTAYTGKLSIGEMNTTLNSLTACTCDAQTEQGSSCLCNGRTACSCQSRTTNYTACDCESRTADGSCSGYTAPTSDQICWDRTYQNACDANVALCIPNCYCNGRTTSCDCVSRTVYPYCNCQDRVFMNICECNTRTAPATCTCNNRGSVCSCVSRTDSYTSCTSNVGADCASRTACTCNTVKIFT
jgi:hypothetical protein